MREKHRKSIMLPIAALPLTQRSLVKFLCSHLIDVANGDGGEVDVAEWRGRRIHRRHHRRLVKLHALDPFSQDINQLINQ